MNKDIKSSYPSDLLKSKNKECIYHIKVTQDLSGIIIKHQIDIKAKDVGSAIVDAIEVWYKYAAWYFLGDNIHFDVIGSTPLYKYEHMIQRKWLGKIVPLYGEEDEINPYHANIDERVKAINRTPEEEGVMV